MPPHFYYLRGALGDPDLLTAHKDSIQSLLAGNYTGKNLEKLKGYNVYSFRLSDKERLLFTLCSFQDPLSLEKRDYLLVLDYLPNHEYHKSRFLQSGVLRQYFKTITEPDLHADTEFSFESTTPNEHSLIQGRVYSDSSAEAGNPGVMDYFRNRFVQLSPEQEDVLSLSLPAAIRGGAGAGKTVTALSIITSYIDSHRHEDGETPQKILYVTSSEDLVQHMQQMWSQLPQAIDCPHEVSFKSIKDIIRDNPAWTTPPSFLGLKDFAAWYDDYFAKICQRAKSKREPIPEKLDANKVYQECRTCAAYSQAEYLALGDKQSLMQKELRPCVYEIYSQYLTYLEVERLIDPSFYRFAEGQRAQWDIVLVDEAQDLGMGALLALTTIAKERRFMLWMDDHQRLQDALPLFSRACDLLGVPQAQRRMLHGAYRCPPPIMAVANKVLAFRDLLAQGTLDKHTEEDRVVSLRCTQAGSVYLLEDEALSSMEWLVEIAKGTGFSVVTQETHREEAKARFQTELVFTPKTIKGLEYRVVLAWRLYPSETFRAIQQRHKALGPMPKQPTHQAKKDARCTDFNPELHAIYTGYTRATELLLVCEPPTPENSLLLNQMRPLADKGTPESMAIPETETSLEAWRQEVDKQLAAGNHSIAEEIFKSRRLGTHPEFQALLTSHTSIPTPSAPASSATQLRPPQPPTASSSSSRSAPTPESRKEKCSKKGREPKIEKAIPPPPSTLLLVSKEQHEAEQLYADFLGRFTIAVEVFDIEKLLLARVGDKAKKPTLFEHIHQNEAYKKEFYATIANNADLFIKMPFKALFSRYAARQYPLLSQLQDCRKRLQGHSNLYTLYHEYTPSHTSAFVGDLETLKVLKECGANLNARHNTGITPAYLAARNGHAHVLDFFYQWGVRLDTPDITGSTSVHIATEKGRIDTLRFLHKHGVNMDAPANDGTTPLLIAAQNGHVDILDLFYQWGGKLDTTDNRGSTSVHSAAKKGHVDTLRFLHKHGANMDAPAHDGTTPLFIAAQNGHVAILEFLYNLKCRLDPPLDDGFTPALIAAQNGHAHIIDRLYTWNASLVTPNKKGATPVFMAAQQGQDEVLRRLHQYGVRLDVARDDGKTPLDVARQCGQHAAVKVLEDLMLKEREAILPSASGVGFFSASPTQVPPEENPAQLLCT